MLNTVLPSKEIGAAYAESDGAPDQLYSGLRITVFVHWLSLLLEPCRIVVELSKSLSLFCVNIM